MSYVVPGPRTVMLLDDHEVIRVGTALWLSRESDLEIIGSFSTSGELFAALAKRRPDIVVVDFMLGPLEIDGVNLIRALRVRYPECRTLVLSAQYTPATVSLALQVPTAGRTGGRHPYRSPRQDLPAPGHGPGGGGVGGGAVQGVGRRRAHVRLCAR